jgi:hypothetical protein
LVSGGKLPLYITTQVFILSGAVGLLASWLQKFCFDFKLHFGTIEANIKFEEEVRLT